jgi:peptide/nickel transport system substrate-binding protein
MHDQMRGHRCRGVVTVIGFVALVAGALAGCSSNQEGASGAEALRSSPIAQKPRPGGHLVYALEGDPNGLDPTRNVWDNAGIQLAGALYDPLVAVDAEGTFQPYLADSVTPNADFTRWTIKLRPGIHFTNNDPVDAAAVVGFFDGLRRSVITGPPVQMMADVRAVDPLTVQITSSRPWASLPALLSGQGGYVVSPKQIDDTKGSENPIGSGPFTLKHWQENKKFELVRNPRYWRAGLPYLDALDFDIIPEGTKRIDQLLSGDIDVTNLSAAWDMKRLDEVMMSVTNAAKINVERDTSDAEKDFVMFNMTKPPLDDVRVRRAIAYATDVPALAKDAGWPIDRLAEGPLSPGTPYFAPATYATYDPDQARELIREYLSDRRIRSRPKEIAFTFRVTDIDAALGQKLVAQWKKVGINAGLDLEDPKQMPRYAVMGDFGAMALRYFSNVDPDVLWHFFVADTIVNEGISLNFNRIRDDQITAGMNEGRATPDVNARKAAYAKVQQAFAKSMPILWLARTEWRVASRKQVHEAHNMTLPDGRRALPLLGGNHRLTETWIDP